MISEGDEVRIIYSNELCADRLLFLIGQRGYVIKCAISNKSPGVYVVIENGKNRGEEWYIPLKSIQSAADVNKIRNTAILKSIKL